MSVPEHSFVVPAYGRSPHLRDCLASLAAQSERSPIVVCTSTPFDGLDAIADDFGARVVLHGPNRGIANDWNEALASVDCGWVTLAHQDDIYLPDFVGKTMAEARRRPDAILAFTDYAEIADSGARSRSLALRIKRCLIEGGMLGRSSVATRIAKTNVLRLGCAIACPTVSLNKGRLPQGMRFDQSYRVDLDWDFWLRLAQDVRGDFLFIREVLMHHRLHEASETTAGIVEGVRQREDLELFSRLWPRPVALALASLYRHSYSFNRS